MSKSVGVLAVLLSTVAAAAQPKVPGYERSRADREHAALAGEILLGELNCTACHKASGALLLRLRPKRAPSLKDLSKRLSPRVAGAFASAPHRFKPGTTMPDLFSGVAKPRAAAARAVAAIAQRHAPYTGRTLATVARGRVLFRTLGCAVCHGATPQTPTAKDVPLRLGMHYRFPELVAFLRDPTKLRPSGRMPHMALSVGDARDLAAFLRSLGTPLPADHPTAENDRQAQREYRVRGCATCHDPQPTTSSFALPFAQLNPEAAQGCLSAAPRSPAAHYHLDRAQRDALIAAIRRLQRAAAPLPPARRLFKTLATFDCFACHERNGRGGPRPDQDELFTGDPDLGNEGRFPPALTGVGRKLTETAMQRVLAGAGHRRPYLHTRMPRFALAHLATDFAQVDRPNQRPMVGGNAAAGRQLIGSNGLGCITCHGLGKNKSIGVHATNLAGITDRVHPGWFRQMLLDPNAFRHGTLMPSFWPKGQATRKDILNGDTDRQIASIWEYLRKPNPAPVGYPPPRGTYEIVPGKRTEILRCFMKGAGNHAIAVGSPQGVHFAFDAERIRPALAWRGRFLDAYSTWFTRFQEPVAPLGTAVTSLPTATFVGRTLKFGGYRLDASGTPTFLYGAGALQIEDRIRPTKDGLGLLRSIRILGARAPLRFDPGKGKVRVLTPKRTDTAAFTVALDRNGNASLEVEYRW